MLPEEGSAELMVNLLPAALRVQPGSKKWVGVFCIGAYLWRLQMSSKSPPPKRQKVGSLLQFGFTENQRNKAVDTPPPPAAVEYEQCETCSRLFPVDKIASHSSRCEASTNSGTNLRNAFDVMKSSASIVKQQNESKTLYFALVKRNDRLLPLIYQEGSYTKELFRNSGNEYNLWECDSNVRKFRMAFRNNTASGKRDIVLHLVTNIPSAGTDSIDQFIAPHNAGSTATTRSPGNPPVSVSVLKSMLQKAVRRKQTLKAIRLATMLCDYDSPQAAPAFAARGPASPIRKGAGAGSAATPKPVAARAGGASPNSPLSELLRRLPIVCFEDTALHPALPVVVWLMIAVTKGYRPPAPLIHTVLLIVADIAACPYKDCTPRYNTDFSTLPPPPRDASIASGTTTSSSQPILAVSDQTTEPPANLSIAPSSYELMSISNAAVRTLLASISLRASFGGMAFDMQMLDLHAQLWHQRLLCCADSSRQTPSSGSDGDGAKVDKVAVGPGCVCLHEDYVDGLLQSHGDWARQLFSNMAPLSAPPRPGTGDLAVVTASHLQQVCSTLLGGAVDAPAAMSASSSQQAPRGAALSQGQGAEALHALLRLGPQDLVAEGVDQHVDYALVPHLVNTCREKLTAYLASQAEGGKAATVTSSAKDSQGAADGIMDSSPVKASSVDIPDHLLQDIQSSIWLFRSSCNSRKLYPLIITHASARGNKSEADTDSLGDDDLSAQIAGFVNELTEKELAGKRRRARLWGIVCPVLVAYCERKVAGYARKLLS